MKFYFFDWYACPYHDFSKFKIILKTKFRESSENVFSRVPLSLFCISKDAQKNVFEYLLLYATHACHLTCSFFQYLKRSKKKRLLNDWRLKFPFQLGHEQSHLFLFVASSSLCMHYVCPETWAFVTKNFWINAKKVDRGKILISRTKKMIIFQQPNLMSAKFDL